MNSTIRIQKDRITTAVSGRNSAWGCCVTGGGTNKRWSGYAPGKTSNELEVIAATEALRSFTDGATVILSTRLEYMRQGVLALTSNGKAGNIAWYRNLLRGTAPNQELWESLRDQLNRHQVEVARFTDKDHAACKALVASFRVPSAQKVPELISHSRSDNPSSSWSSKLEKGTVAYMFQRSGPLISSVTEDCRHESAADVIDDVPAEMDEVPW